jgi:tetratricopeptide (TPR) repeat protein
MRNGRKKITALMRAFVITVFVTVAGLTCPVQAGGDGLSANESIVIEGPVSHATINNTVNNQDPAILAAMTKTFADQMAATTDARVRAEAKATELAQKLGFTSSAVAQFFKILGEENVTEQKIPGRLIEIATHFAQTRDELASLEPDDPHTAELARAAAQALESGRLHEADLLLDQAKEAELAALRQARELVQKAQEAADRHALTAAKLLAGRGNIALTQLRYADAVTAFNQAVTLVPSGKPEVAVSILEMKAEALYHQGDEQGDNAALQQAIEAWQGVLQYRSMQQDPLQWAMAKTNLASSLERLGERENGTERLKQAVAAYHAALAPVADYYALIEEDSHDRVSWTFLAVTQLDMGAALEVLGEREAGAGWLEKAVAADRAALAEYSGDDAPLEWALTEINLGNVLQTLAEREGNAAQLEEAVASYRAALAKCTRDRVPLKWALAQNNLGKALWFLATQENRTDLLEQSIGAYRAALEVRTRERVPLDWAMTENNLGIALKTLGEREIGTAQLDEAVSAYRRALEEYTPDRVPVRWAMTQMNLGNALLILGQREQSSAQLQQAVAAYRAALDRDPLPIDRSSSQFNMGLALVALGKPAQAFGCFQQSEAVFRAVGMPQPAAAASRWIARLRQQAGTSSPAACTP